MGRLPGYLFPTVVLRFGMGINWNSIPTFSNAACKTLFILKSASLVLNTVCDFRDIFTPVLSY